MLDTSLEDIAKAPRNWCEKWWRVCNKKVPKNTRVAELRSEIAEWRNKLQPLNARLIIDKGVYGGNGGDDGDGDGDDRGGGDDGGGVTLMIMMLMMAVIR